MFNRENNSQRSTSVNERVDDQNPASSIVRALKKSNNSEFIEELCWDVEPEGQTKINDLEIKIVSPRIKANIGDCEIAVLVDCGSEVTAVSENFYDQLKTNIKIAELPVSNLTVNVAVGNKSTTIKRQIQLKLCIGKEVLESPFLVIPGLDTNVLVGIDWLSRFKCVIDVGNKKIKVGGKELPDSLVSFRMSHKTKTMCRVIHASGLFWYNADMTKCRLGNGITKIQEEAQTSGSEPQGDRSEINTRYLRQMSNNEKSFDACVEEYVKGLRSLVNDQRNEVRKLLVEYRAVFSDEPGCTRVYEHQIILKNNKNVVRKSYPVALSQRSAVNKEIQDMLELDIIEPSNSEHCNPVHVVPKKNGKVRLCLDARFINACIFSDNECPPRIEELLQKFEGATFFSTTDLVYGYW